MTPAIDAARKAGIAFHIHEYQHDPSAASYGLEAAEKMGVPPEQVFKTLVAEAGIELVVAIIPVEQTLNLKKIARAAGAKKAAMAEGKKVERSSGYVLGGVSPLGQKRALRTFVDESAAAFREIYVSAGKRGLEIQLAPQDLLKLTGGELASLCN
ncbi:Cys-tRNA(Pro) deacylase [Parahaliea aestuarii]|uniref:Cys-tRNA(Pro)/Cys-tRNA(Cys) deacylase n=1 Tax=Parahaliea aestuarii TaxID=1852021 RepID=A0A5C8ZSZ7_9GAMM|nr:Cys-tRNA(Pro) deacylase [Parahaliea aestuarii]TXS90914.1 Cys-tRNA(Pro) deacylase [Parahaliea aestuarii]